MAEEAAAASGEDWSSCSGKRAAKESQRVARADILESRDNGDNASRSSLQLPTAAIASCVLGLEASPAAN